MEKIKVTQIRSIIKSSENQKRTIQALGLKNVRDSVEHVHTPQIKGMINNVKHLVHTEIV